MTQEVEHDGTEAVSRQSAIIEVRPQRVGPAGDLASRLSSLTDEGSGNSIHFDYETSSSLVRKIGYRNPQGTEVAATAKTWDRLNRVRTLTTTKRTGRVVSSFKMGTCNLSLS